MLEVVNKILEADESKELLSNAERRRNLKGQSHTFVPERDPDYVAPSSKDRVNGESATRRIPNSRATGSSTARRAVE